jgi:hypothetical protein
MTASRPLPEKSCAVCGRRMEWRRKWARNWEEVRYCSHRCRSRSLDATDRGLEAAVVRLLAVRGASASICPSEAARAVEPGAWRPLMERAREAGRRLAARKVVVFRQKGRTVDPSTAKGALRLARGPGWARRDETAPGDAGRGGEER